MQSSTKTIIKWLLIIVAFVIAGYVLYKIYNYAVEDATKRIRHGVSKGVSEGVGEGVGSAFNPITWPKRMFGN